MKKNNFNCFISSYVCYYTRNLCIGCIRSQRGNIHYIHHIFWRRFIYYYNHFRRIINHTRCFIKNRKKTATFYNSDNVAQWSATLKGTFTYNGSSATCTASSITHKIYSSNWKTASASTTKSGNKATAKRYLIVPVQTVEKTITLTCSASGVLS